MTQKVSNGFSGSLFVHFLRRFWPVMVVVFIGTALSLWGSSGIFFGSFQYSGIDAGHTEIEDSLRYLNRSIVPLYIVRMFIFAPIVAALVFRHLHNRAETQFYLELPISRLDLYCTIWLAGLCLIGLPLMVAMGCFGIVELVLGFAGAAGVLLLSIGAVFVSLLFFYSLAVLSCVLAGRTSGAILMYVAFNVLGFMLYLAAMVPLRVFLVGVPIDTAEIEDVVLWLTPIAKMIWSYVRYGAGFGIITHYFGEPFDVFFLAGLVVSVFAALLYCVRKAERAGETIAFSGMRTAFEAMFAIVILTIGAQTLNLWFLRSSISSRPFTIVLVILLFAALGWIVAEMIVCRTPRIFNRRMFAKTGVFMAIVTVCIGLIAADIFGVGRFVPEPTRVESAVISYSGIQTGTRTTSVEPEEAIACHQKILENKNLLVQYENSTSTAIGFEYQMEDGSVVKRVYNVVNGESSHALKQELETLLSQTNYIHQRMFNTSARLSENDFLIGTLNCYDDASMEDSSYISHDLAPSDCYSLYRAMWQDIEHGNVHPYSSEGYTGDILFELRTTAGVSGADDYGIRGANDDSVCYIDITSSMTYTNEWVDAYLESLATERK